MKMITRLLKQRLRHGSFCLRGAHVEFPHAGPAFFVSYRTLIAWAELSFPRQM